MPSEIDPLKTTDAKAIGPVPVPVPLPTIVYGVVAENMYPMVVFNDYAAAVARANSHSKAAVINLGVPSYISPEIDES